MSVTTITPQLTASEAFLGIPEPYASVPQRLKDQPNWTVWRLEKRGVELTKVPYDAKTGKKAASNRPETWCDFATAVRAAENPSNKYAGIGFEFGGSPFTSVEFDGTVVDGVTDPYVIETLKQFGNPYTEVSPSGTGLHAFVEGKLPEGLKHKFGTGDHYGAEIYSTGRYFTVTGVHHSGSGVPALEDWTIPHFLCSQILDKEFKHLWTYGDEGKSHSGDDRSASGGDFQLVLKLIAAIPTKDSAVLDKYFRKSLRVRDSARKEKWDRLGAQTIANALEGDGLQVSEKTGESKKARKIIEFHHFPTEETRAKWTDFDYVVAPPEGQFDGWFPLGSPSLIGGSSGSGKTTFLLDLCVRQAVPAPFYGHETFGRPYIVLMLDRGKGSHTRTMRRLGFTTNQVPIKFIRAVVDGDASQEIINQIEADPEPIPQVVFVEGMDMLVSDASKMEVVMPFMSEMQQIAEHFHIAIIGSVGAPKTKKKEGYAAKRDTIFGSALWSRMSETIVAMEFPDGDDTADSRVISVLPRNAKAETFHTSFEHGRLVETPQPQESEKHVSPKVQAARDFLRRELQDGQPKVGKELQEKAHRTENIQRAMIYDAVKWLHVNTEAGTVGEGRKKQNLWQLTPAQVDANDPRSETF